MEYTSDQSEELISHFGQIAEFVTQQERDVWANLGRINQGRSDARTRRFQRSMDEEFKHLFFHGHSWADTGIVDAWEAGYRTVTGLDESIALKGVQSKELGQLRERFRKRLNDAEKYLRQDSRRFLRDARNTKAEQVAAAVDRGEDPFTDMSIRSFRSAGRRPRRWYLDSFGEMQVKATRQQAYNLGIVHGADFKGIEFVEVADGPNCGWTSHEDTEKANGKIVELQEARNHPLAHPNCVRSFVPRPDLNGKGQKDRKSLSKVQKAAAVAAGAAAAGLLARTLFEVRVDIVDQELAKNIAAAASKLDTVYLRTFARLRDQSLEKFHFPPPEDFQEVELPRVVGGNHDGPIFRIGDDPDPFTPPKLSVVGGEGGGPPSTLRGWQDDVVAWGDRIANKSVDLDRVPKWVKDSLHLPDIKKGQPPDNDVAAAIFNFNRWVHAKRVNEKGVEVGAKILNYQAKRRNWNEFFVLKHSEDLGSAISATWTKYGPRTRIDLTDFMRGRITLTKTGVRRSITLNPKGNLRTMLALSQDGTLMGALRLVPNRVFRAIIETDEFGKISGNIRLVPKGPFKMRLEFETPRPKNWQYKGLVPGEDFVDLRARAREARQFGLDDFTFHDIYETLSQLQLRRVVFEADIFDRNLFQIHNELKIPIPQLRETVERMLAAKKLRRAGETAETAERLTGFTGTIEWIPSKDTLRDLQKALSIADLKILGEAKFSSLHSGFKTLLPDVRSAAYFAGTEFKQVLTSMKVSGLDVIKNMTNFQLMDLFDIPLRYYDQVKEAVDETEAQLVMFLRKNQRPQVKIGKYVALERGPLFKVPKLSPSDLSQYMEERFAQLITRYGDVGNRADIYQGVLEAVRGVADNEVVQLARKQHRIVPGGRTHQGWLKILAGIEDTDGKFQIERKLDDLVGYMRATALDSGEIAGTLDGLSPEVLSAAARQFVRKNVRTVEKKLELIDPERILGSRWEGLFRKAIVEVTVHLRTNDVMKNLFADRWNKFLWAWNQAKTNQEKLKNIDPEEFGLLLRQAGAMKGPIDNIDEEVIQRVFTWDNSKIKDQLGLDLGNMGETVKTRYLAPVREDIIRSWWGYRQNFPDLPPLKVEVPTMRTFLENSQGSTLGYYSAKDARIVINPAVARYWREPVIDTMLKANALTGRFVGSAARGPIHIISHEMGHHVHLSLFESGEFADEVVERQAGDETLDWIRNLYEEEIKKVLIAKLGGGWDTATNEEKERALQTALVEDLSVYGGANEFESFAEGLASWLLDHRGERIAQKIGDYLTLHYKDAPKFSRRVRPRQLV